ncbi:hypothetical protein BAUCODRAFT_150667 [Baudoinia panamericana UAMH 10762]|uniref:Uncharacterized protein n=1 Tax=Baudoinia panamericana (strain UAMH 10762) TaxID=717646 RepID=M2N2W2_BAUPA|nr:uncharacterized protein BAUCODRAFT_150667 [Baudoinia panamericana UAMH 10762]EMC93319.1 hypothetical protein BAUCODRAFT_150667 [Baudoinia panamericana UAMH 10762]
MAMLLPRPSTCGTRPAYLDNLFRDAPPVPALSPSVHSSTSSISSGSMSPSEIRMTRPLPPPLPPSMEEPSDDVRSLRSFKVNFGSRFNVRSVFKRRTYPEATEISRPPSPASIHSQEQPALRRPSLPKLQTAFPSPGRKLGLAQDKPLPRAPSQVSLKSQELSCHRCYYFAARNCNGFVMGGKHGDACEQCLRAGFFGAP